VYSARSAYGAKTDFPHQSGGVPGEVGEAFLSTDP